MEDDIELVDNFKEKLNYCVNECEKNDYDYTFISGFNIINKNKNIENLIINEIKYIDGCNGTSGYIISKNGAQKILGYIYENGLQFAIDKLDILYNSLIKIYTVNEYIGYAYICSNTGDTDIQRDFDNFDFSKINDI